MLVSAVEHHAVLDPAFWMAEHAGAELVLLPVDAEGMLDVDALREELGAHGDQDGADLRDVGQQRGRHAPAARDVVALARQYGVPVHTDAVQAVGQVPVDFAASGLDAMTVTGHKVGGPGGVGALLARRGLDADARAARRRAGAWGAVRARSTPPCRVVRAGRRAGGRGPRAFAARVGRAARRPRRRVSGRGPRGGAARTAGPRRGGCPRTRTSRSPAARATRCCTCWTPRASRRRPGRPARPGCRSRSHVLLAMGVDEVGRARRAAVQPRAHVDRRRRRRAARGACRGVVARARAAGLATVGTVT